MCSWWLETLGLFSLLKNYTCNLSLVWTVSEAYSSDKSMLIERSACFTCARCKSHILAHLYSLFIFFCPFLSSLHNVNKPFHLCSLSNKTFFRWIASPWDSSLTVMITFYPCHTFVGNKKFTFDMFGSRGMFHQKTVDGHGGVPAWPRLSLFSDDVLDNTFS